MRKNLLILATAALLPCLAWADNMAIEKKRATSYGSSNVTENRLGIPCEAAGFSSPMDGSESYTIATWVKPSNVYGSGAALVALSPQVHMNTNGNWVLNCSSSGAISITGHAGMSDHGATAAGITGATDMTVALDEWNYITVVVDNANLKFSVYLNGEIAIDKTMNEPLYFPSTLQSNGDGPAWFHVGGQGVDALIDEVHAFNRALTAEEVAKAYKNPSSLGGLTGYYTFDEQNGVGYFDNLAPDAAENSSAVFWKWAGSYLWGGWVNGTNTATEATLVAGREIEAAEPATRSYVGTCDYYFNNSFSNSFSDRTLTFNREADGTYSIHLAEIPFDGYDVDFKGITREGDKISGTADSFYFMGQNASDATLEGTVTDGSISLTIHSDMGGVPLDVNFEGSNLSSVGSVAVDNADAPAEYYTLQGVRIPAANLTPGLYIVRRGNTVTKTYIR